VLVAIYERAGELGAVLTRRRGDLPRHGGEISFPGGRREPGEDLRATALRETEEEIGLPSAAVELLGALPPTPTRMTSFAVHPFVGAIEAGHRWRPSAAEVADVLELPLRALRDSAHRRRLVRHGMAFRTEVYALGGNLVWGATARILDELFTRIAPLL
jgi:8-oxo-dGTP pyrophosphatase MutT (NUDIX family)